LAGACNRDNPTDGHGSLCQDHLADTPNAVPPLIGVLLGTTVGEEEGGGSLETAGEDSSRDLDQPNFRASSAKVNDQDALT
jgi:hypothetical protein